MKKALLIIAVLALTASCGWAGRKKATEAPPPEPKSYDEMVTEYENVYDADDRLVKVVERDYPVLLGEKLPFDNIRTYEYEYRRLPDGATGQHKYRILSGGGRELTQIVISSPRHRDEFCFDGRDTTLCDKRRFDAAGRLTMKEYRSKMSVPEFDMDSDTYTKEEYEYDALGREVKKTWHCVMSGEESGYVIEMVYRGDTNEIVSEKQLLGEGSTTEYRREFSGDTLVRRGYRNGALESVEKSVPGYKSTTGYWEGIAEDVFEVISDGDRRIEVDRDLLRGSWDSIYYSGDLKTRWSAENKTWRMTYIYQYDEHGNMTSERSQALWFDEEPLNFGK